MLKPLLGPKPQDSEEPRWDRSGQDGQTREGWQARDLKGSFMADPKKGQACVRGHRAAEPPDAGVLWLPGRTGAGVWAGGLQYVLWARVYSSQAPAAEHAAPELGGGRACGSASVHAGQGSGIVPGHSDNGEWDRSPQLRQPAIKALNLQNRGGPGAWEGRG